MSPEAVGPADKTLIIEPSIQTDRQSQSTERMMPEVPSNPYAVTAVSIERTAFATTSKLSFDPKLLRLREIFGRAVMATTLAGALFGFGIGLFISVGMLTQSAGVLGPILVLVLMGLVIGGVWAFLVGIPTVGLLVLLFSVLKQADGHWSLWMLRSIFWASGALSGWLSLAAVSVLANPGRLETSMLVAGLVPAAIGTLVTGIYGELWTRRAREAPDESTHDPSMR